MPNENELPIIPRGYTEQKMLETIRQKVREQNQASAPKAVQFNLQMGNPQDAEAAQKSVQEYQDKIAVFHAELSKWNDANEPIIQAWFRDEVLEYREHLQSRGSDYAELAGLIDELRGEVEQLRGELDELRGELDELRGEVEDTGEIDILRGEVQGLESRISELEQ